MTLKMLNILTYILLAYLALGCKKEDPVEIFEIRPIVGDYYVSPDGNDSNNGSKTLPFRSIQKAVGIMAPGDTVVVIAGDYPECVTISKSGSSESTRLLIFSESLHGAKCSGFRIKGDFVTLDGFDVEADAVKNYVGISVAGKSNVEILNCKVHECPMGGINFAHDAVQGSNNARIINNILEHNGQWGINLIGSNGLIEGNEITKTVQHHPKGDEPGFQGNDADGLRIFGDNHIIRGNRVLDIGDPGDGGNIDPHVDCLQTWDGSLNGQPVMTNTIIEGNYFRVKHFTGKGILLESTTGNACHHLIIRNNIFEYRDIGVAAFSGEFHDIFIYNNVFNSILSGDSWGTSVALTNVTNYDYRNNITVDCHKEHRKILGGSGIVDYNLAWSSDGSHFTMEPGLQAHDLMGVNPKFVKYTGNFGENDYHLQAGSPAINAGAALSDVPNDFDGTARPQGSGYDIGAFEFH